MGVFSSKAPDNPSSVEDGVESSIRDRLKFSFDPAYYLSKNPDVLEAGADPLEHFIKFGWKENRRPNDWFDPVEYASRHPETLNGEINPFLHFLMYKDLPTEDLDKSLQTLHKNRVLYWADKYFVGENGPRPVIIASDLPKKEDLTLVAGHFDVEYYCAQNENLADRWVNPLLHFMTIGWVEMRDPSPDFSVSYYLRKNKDIQNQGINPFVHYLKHGVRELWRQSATVADAAILYAFEKDPDLLALVAEAKRLDPMVSIPAQTRKITSPLDAVRRANVAETLRSRLSTKSYKYIVAVPHVRMSGASRVAAIFTEALAQVRDPSEILVVTTDSSESEYIRWFSEKTDVFDLSREIEGLGSEDRSRALIDVLRGVNCRTIINVNSRLVWEAMRLFGRQIHQEFRVVTYLFTWDENANGDRVGYPIQWLRDTASNHHLLLTDTKNLADDVKERLGFECPADGAQVIPIHTPITIDDRNSGVSRSPDNRSGHFLWAGRFDPQKRLDILVDIARANPRMTFDVYGKTVLGSKSLDEYDPPDNIIPKGTYTDLQEVLRTPYSGFLYTSQWDGLPTILLDMASAGLPIVAPNVGGISELIDHNTGWLVDNFEDVDSFSGALAEIIAFPTQAKNRVEALRTVLEDRFAPSGYIKSIKELVAKYEL